MLMINHFGMGAHVNFIFGGPVGMGHSRQNQVRPKGDKCAVVHLVNSFQCGSYEGRK
jgi:hypothetical protein